MTTNLLWFFYFLSLQELEFSEFVFLEFYTGTLFLVRFTLRNFNTRKNKLVLLDLLLLVMDGQSFENLNFIRFLDYLKRVNFGLVCFDFYFQVRTCSLISLFIKRVHGLNFIGFMTGFIFLIFCSWKEFDGFYSLIYLIKVILFVIFFNLLFSG